ncbi:hypothetical protein MMC09_001979 [Bachmanniomyces sp. S44760]|nr:hypothetical protein [Bachmanniomyces sp. S44760]
MEWTKKQYNSYYNDYMPWVEDKYLQYFGENKTSYTAKEQLKGANITGDKNIGAVTDGVAEGVGGQFSSGGLLGGVGDASSKEGFNRAERGDTGPLGDLQKETEKKEKPKGWTESLSGGYLGGGVKK